MSIIDRKDNTPNAANHSTPVLYVYAVRLFAYNLTADPPVFAAVPTFEVVTSDEIRAIDLALKLGCELWPIAEGWSEHGGQVSLVAEKSVSLIKKAHG